MPKMKASTLKFIIPNLINPTGFWQHSNSVKRMIRLQWREGGSNSVAFQQSKTNWSSSVDGPSAIFSFDRLSLMASGTCMRRNKSLQTLGL